MLSVAPGRFATITHSPCRGELVRRLTTSFAPAGSVESLPIIGIVIVMGIVAEPPDAVDVDGGGDMS
jgi:hypothetical protein